MEINHDKRIGENIASYRQGRSQDWLAEQMRARGHKKWSQSTVWSVEAGRRPLRFTEAHDVAAILDQPIESLMLSRADGVVFSAMEEVRDAEFRGSEALLDLVNKRVHLAEVLQNHAGGDIAGEAEGVLQSRDIGVYQCPAGHGIAVLLATGKAPWSHIECNDKACARRADLRLAARFTDPGAEASDG